MSGTGLIETEKKWNRIESKTLAEIETFIDSGSLEVGDRMKLCAAVVKECVRNKAVVLHEKIYELTLKRFIGAPKKVKALKAGLME